jgi:hypothetical protein
MKPLRIAIITVASITVIAVGVFAWMVLDESVGFPPQTLTANRMWLIKRRILRFAQSHNQLPHSLSDLPVMMGYDNSTRDEWGRDIAYDVSALGLVTLTSLGRDGRIGGTGKNADMVATFTSHDTQGRWSGELVDWSHSPFSQ